MFFWLSKILWAMAAPSNLLGGLLVVSAAGLFTRYSGMARRGLVLAAGLYVAFGSLPLGLEMLRPLENRFPRPTQMERLDGIIVLGGGMDEVISANRNLAQLAESGSRMSEAALLARRFPQARVVFTGGSGRMSAQTATEAEAARRFFLEQGLAPERLAFEDRSRNTWENAVLTRELVQPSPGERWALVTSAFHMPRSVGIFRKVGFEVIPFPADYNTLRERVRLTPSYEAGMGLHLLDRAVREYIGLAAYYLTGKTSALFPSP